MWQDYSILFINRYWQIKKRERKNDLYIVCLLDEKRGVLCLNQICDITMQSLSLGEIVLGQLLLIYSLFLSTLDKNPGGEAAFTS